jgi:hypothetical protein
MTQKQALIAVVAVLLSFMLFNLAACVEPFLDESFSVSGAPSFVESRVSVGR